MLPLRPIKKQKTEAIQPFNKVNISKFEPQINEYGQAGRIESIDIMPNKMIVTLESSFQRYDYNLCFHYQNSIQKIPVDSKSESVCALADGKHVLTYYQHKKGRIYFDLWNSIDLKKGNSINFKPAFIDSGFIDILSTNNFLLLHYQCRDITHGEHSHIELRDSATLAKLDNKKSQGFYKGFVSPYDPNAIFYNTKNGFEYWRIINNCLKKMGNETLPRNEQLFSLGMLIDGKTIISGHKWGEIRFWDLQATGDKVQINLINYKQSNRIYYADDLAELIVIPDGKHIVSWNGDNATLWDISNKANPTIINKVFSAQLGYGKGLLTDDWEIITSRNIIIQFPELITARELYQKEVANLLINRNYADMPPRSLDKIILDYCFFKPQLPITAPIAKEEIENDAHENEILEYETLVERHGMKRKLITI